MCAVVVGGGVAAAVVAVVGGAGRIVVPFPTWIEVLETAATAIAEAEWNVVPSCETFHTTRHSSSS